MADILIKNMEMPSKCGGCPFNYREQSYNGKPCGVRDGYTLYDRTTYDTNHLCFITIASIEDNLRYKTRNENCPLIPVPEHGDLIARGWHLGEPSKNEQGWFLTKVMVRDCDGTFFPEYEACFKYEEWVGRRHRQPVVAYQLIEPTEDSLAVVLEKNYE